MGESDATGVTCPNCAARYRWRSDRAGQSVRCKCGHVFQMPASPSAGSAEAAPPGRGPIPTNPAATADPPPPNCPSCGAQLKEDVVICLNCGFDTKSGRKLQTDLSDDPPTEVAGATDEQSLLAQEAVENLPDAILIEGSDEAEHDPDELPEALPFEAPKEDVPPAYKKLPMLPAYMRRPTVSQDPPEDDEKQFRWLEYKLPWIMVAVGAVAQMAWGFWEFQPNLTRGALAGLTLIALQLFVVVPVLLCVILFVASTLKVAFGSLDTAILKLTGIAMGPGVIADVIYIAATKILFEVIVCETMMAAGFLLYLLNLMFVGYPMAKLFDLDMTETSATTVVVMIIKGAFLIFGIPLLHVLFQ